MLPIYIFSLVLGGGFLLVSLLGDALGSDAVELELDTDLDLDAEIDVGGDVDVEAAAHDTDGGHGGKLFSLRTGVYTLFGFGAVGTLLSFLDPGGAATLAFALLGGALSGAMINVLFNYLLRTDSGARVGDHTFVGLTGSMTLPLSSTAPGTVVVDRGHRRVPLRALPHASAAGSDVTEWETVVVVEMSDGVARVAPVEDDLAREP